ncbi:hypothetical protein [Streptomyces sp. NPDC055607]
MRGDETQSALAKGGPRHAAPRKTLLNRIQGPAGKAMALAAMPTAVFVGMGLTPKVALADDEIPFAPGPCVTRSDEPTPEASETAKETDKQKETAKPTATPSATATASPSATPSATATPTPTATATEQATTQRKPAATTAPKPAATPTPTAAPTPAKSKNPLDPLGLGDALKDLFDGPDEKPAAAPTTAPTTPAPTAPATTTAPKATADPTAGRKAAAAPKPTADPAAERTKAAIRGAAEKAGVETEELPESAQGLDAKKDEDIPEGAKPRFPCPERDDAALAAAEVEPGIPLLPDEPWILESSKLTLLGLKYHGIVEVKTYGGKIKKALKFTATTVKIEHLHQITDHSEGRSAHVRATRTDTPSTITGGTVTMYTEELKGNLFGIIPVTFGPESPPPLDVPLAIFTDVKIKQAGQFGGTLRIPGLRNTIEPS